mmetsp:Transcript_42798/g.130152  ORF Transcript_42798/g.130152 Transcript_42798/m.130152 type:complete len:303 (-) Transcript_42798:146-1054(-)
MSTPYHGEGIGTGERARTGYRRDRLLPRVDVIGIGVIGGGVRTYAHESVLGLKFDPYIVGDEIGRERGHSYAEVDVHAVFEFAGGAAHYTAPSSTDHLGLVAVLVGGGDLETFDSLFVVGRVNETVNIHPREVYLVRAEFSRLHNLLGLGDANPPRHGAVGIGVPGRSPKDEIPPRIGLPCLDEADVGVESLLHDVLSRNAVPIGKFAYFAGRTLDLGYHRSVRFVFDGYTPLGVDRAGAGGGVEGGYSGSRGAETCGDGTLGGELHLEFATEEHTLEVLLSPRHFSFWYNRRKHEAQRQKK